MIPERKKRNSSKINLIVSVVFHSALILAVFFFAAREGMLGKKLKQITVTMVPKEKPPEPPKQKPPEPKVEPPKVAETPKEVVPTTPPKVEQASAPPPVDAAPAVAPATVSMPAFEFSDGAHEVQTVSDPNALYKGLVEHALRSRWERPDDMEDQTFVADVELTVAPTGDITTYSWVKGSGNQRWDDSVKSALAKTKTISRPPPKGFPSKFLVRFDVETVEAADSIQVSSR
jgi:outer membrane biosynthesis protein TonB